MTSSPTLDLIVPVYNEASTVECQVRRLHRFLSDDLPLSWQITVADNASTDATGAIVVGQPGPGGGVHGRGPVHRPARPDAVGGAAAVGAQRGVHRQLLDHVRDEEWFFDTELLMCAQRAGMRIYEVPVDWVDDPDSRVDIVRTALADLRGVGRLMLAPRPAGSGAQRGVGVGQGVAVGR